MPSAFPVQTATIGLILSVPFAIDDFEYAPVDQTMSFKNGNETTKDIIFYKLLSKQFHPVYTINA